MVICGVCFFKSDLNFLEEIGVKDSKKLSPKRRAELSEKIKSRCQNYKVDIINAQEIDARIIKRITLNQMEESSMAGIINHLKPHDIYVDAADVNEERFGITIQKLLEYKPLKIISKHKADDIYPIVSAASIIAKDLRDQHIHELRLVNGDFGSGYPSDPKTIEFLREVLRKNKKYPYFVRKSWDTAKKILQEEITNRKITDFLS